MKAIGIDLAENCSQQIGQTGAHLPIIDGGIVIVLEYGSSSTGITVTSKRSANDLSLS